MRIASFDRGLGPTYGLLEQGRLCDVGRVLRDEYPKLKTVLEAAAIGDLERAAAPLAFDLSRSSVTFHPVIPNPAKILCVGVNYDAHRVETGRARSEYPVIFTRFANTLVGDGQPLVRPKVSVRLDFEGELAVVMGKCGRHIPEADALEYIAGYTCFNDATVRDWQRHTHQFTPGKNFPGTGALGPAMITASEVPDPGRLSLTTRVNDREVQRSTTEQMIFSIPKLIAYISTFTELSPGDIIATGTPSGVGDKRDPPLYLKAGDVVSVEISKVGTLVNPVIDET